MARGSRVCRESWDRQVSAARPAELCRIPGYAESHMKVSYLARSWRTTTIRSIRHSGRELKAFQKGQQVIIRPIETCLCVDRSCLRDHLFLDSKIGVQSTPCGPSTS